MEPRELKKHLIRIDPSIVIVPKNHASDGNIYFIIDEKRYRGFRIYKYNKSKTVYRVTDNTAYGDCVAQKHGANAKSSGFELSFLPEELDQVLLFVVQAFKTWPSESPPWIVKAFHPWKQSSDDSSYLWTTKALEKQNRLHGTHRLAPV